MLLKMLAHSISSAWIVKASLTQPLVLGWKEGVESFWVESMKFSELKAFISSDLSRTAGLWSHNDSMLSRIKLIFMPAMVAVILYRLSSYFYVNNFKLLAWVVYAFNMTLTGAEFLPYSKIGRGLMLGHSQGTIIAGKLGNNVTVFGQTVVGGGIGDKSIDIGAGPGLPVIEDNVVLGVRSTILGAVLIGEGATISACAFVHEDVPAGALAIGSPSRISKEKTTK